MIVGVVVLFALATWRLSEGPVALDFLRPYLRQTVNTAQGPITLAADRIHLSWEIGEAPMRLVFDDVQAIDSAGATVARVPAATVDLGLARLFTGSFSPTSIVIDRVILDVVISREGLMSMLLPSADIDPSARFLPVLVEQLLKEPNDADVFGRLNEVRINSARLRIDDRTTGFIWEAPAAAAVMLRDEVGVLVRARTELQAGDQTATMDFSSVYSRNREKIQARLSVTNLRPSLFSGASKELATLALLDLPMNGRLELDASGEGLIRSIRVDLQGGAGLVSVPGLFAQPKSVTGAALRVVAFPAQRVLQVEKFDVGFDGPTLSVVGKILGNGNDFVLQGRAELKDMPAARMAEFWPPAFSPGGRTWATTNVTTGVLDRAVVEFSLKGPLDAPNRAAVEHIEATLAYHDMLVTYIPGMFPVRDVSGTARFDGKVLRFETRSGQCGEVAVPSTTIDVLGLDGDGPHRVSVIAEFAANASDAMSFLEQPKLGIPREVLFNPDRLGGQVQGQVRATLPLVSGVAVDQVEYSATVKLKQFSLTRAFETLNLTDGDAVLNVDAKELSVKGRARIEGVPLDIAWRENFNPRVTPRRRYEVRGTVAIPTLAKLGILVPEKRASGSVLVDAVYQSNGKGQSEVTAKLGLLQAKLAVPELHWEKPAGQDAQAVLSARFKGALPSAVDIDATGPGLAGKGRVELGPGAESWQQISIARLAIGQSELAATIRRIGNGLSIEATARTLELERLRQLKSENSGQAGGPPANVTLSFDIAQLLLKRGSISNLRGNARLAGDKVLAADVRVGTGSMLRIQPAGSGRSIVIVASDFGGLLRSAGWVDGLAGGRLEVEAQSDETQPGSPLHAKVALKDFRLARVPAGRQISNLNDVIDGLDRLGDPLAPFELLEARAEQVGDLVTIRRMRTNNGSVGIAATGTFNKADDTVRLEGTGIPAFVVNSLLSNIPLVGTLLTGGPGGGIFAVNFGVSGPIDNPRVGINPVSMLAPGILRSLFGVGGLDDDVPGRSKSSEPRNGNQPP